MKMCIFGARSVQSGAMVNPAFRPMRHTDIPILAHWIAQIPLWQRYQLTAPRLQESLNNALARGERLIVADTEEGTAVGLAWCLLEGAFGRSPYLRLLGVSVQQKGLGAALLLHLEQQLEAHTLFLLVSDFNHDAQRFYQRQGYQQIGAIPGYVLPEVTELLYWKRWSR